jgi:hypothetical protein
MPYRPTQERDRYIERTEPKPLPIEGDTIQIGKYRGRTVDWVRKKDPGWFRWACENVRDFKFLSEL